MLFLAAQIRAQTGTDMLRSFLRDDMLLWGCMAMALIALVTVGKVASRRRKAGKLGVKMRAQSKAVHDFLSSVRSQAGTAQRGVWHYDFGTGAQQFSGDFQALIGGEEAAPPDDRAIEEIFKSAGLDLVRLARDHFEQTEPFEVEFALKLEGPYAKTMILRACNLRGASGEVHRMVALISEAPTAAKP